MTVTQNHSATSPELPLSGARVLDLSRVLAGPLCTMMLADMGADVIKIERPGTGDESRGWGPPFDENGISSYFLSVNRNKKSVALDLSLESSLELISRLLAGADIVVDNFLPGALSRLGLDPEKWLRDNESLIWCSISGFGPHSTRPGYDFVVQAEQGWMSITGAADGSPQKTGIALADIVTGKDAAIAILAVLAATSRSAGPLSASARRINISLAQSAASALINVAQNTLLSGRDPVRHGNAHPNLVPYQLFSTLDGAVVIAIGNDDQWRRALQAIGGLEDLDSDDELRTNPGRVRHRERVIQRLSDRLVQAPSSQWMTALESASVPCGIVRTVTEVLSAVEASPLWGVAPSVPGRVRMLPPLLGAHTAVVQERGWDAFR